MSNFPSNSSPDDRGRFVINIKEGVEVDPALRLECETSYYDMATQAYGRIRGLRKKYGILDPDILDVGVKH